MFVGFLNSRSRFRCILRYLGFESSQNIIPIVNTEGNGHSCGALCLAAEIASTDTVNAEEVRATSGIAIGS
jgi:uncharacterized protein YwlG (UPF0340 family)